MLLLLVPCRFAAMEPEFVGVGEPTVQYWRVKFVTPKPRMPKF